MVVTAAGAVAAADGQFLQGVTILQDIPAIGGDAVREGDGREVIAATEGIIADAGHALEEGHILQAAVAECIGIDLFTSAFHGQGD